MQRKNSDAELQQAVNAVAECGSIADAARKLDIPRNTLDSRIASAKQRGIKANSAGADLGYLAEKERVELQDRVRDLTNTIKAMHRKELTEDRVRDEIFGLSNSAVRPPSWALEPMRKSDRPGIPSVMWSDWHWGEVVEPRQIQGVNTYNVTVAKRRLRRLVERTIGICFQHMTNPNYPGIVVNLGGDIVSGDIHEELSETNELTSMQTMLDVTGALIWSLDALAEKFGRVWVIGVAGNHGRTSRKPRAKNRAFTNFDWTICMLLQRHYAKDKRFSWQIPDGSDASYQVYNHRYLLTHGDQFRGGDGMVGALGPLIRGDHKKRSRNSQVNLPYDTMIFGHWHQYISLRKLIGNGSLKGYDEYAAQSNFPFEPPIQALWFTHPTYGMTAAWPIYCEDPNSRHCGEAVVLGEM